MEGRHFVVGGSRWLGWEAVEGRVDFEDDEAVVVVVAAAANHGTHVSFAYSSASRGAKDIPEVGTDADWRSNAGLGDVGYCKPAAMAHRAVVVGNCWVGVAKVVMRPAELGRRWRYMGAELDCLEGEGGNSVLRCNSRLLSFFYESTDF